MGLPRSSTQAVALVEKIVEVADDCAEILAGGDCAPSADGVEAHSNRAFGKQGGCFVTDDGVGMVDAEDEEGDAVAGALAIFAGAVGGGELVCANDVLGAEVARAKAVGAAKMCGTSFMARAGRPSDGRMAFVLNGLGESGADVAAKGIVAGQGFVGALEDDDVLLALEGGDDGGLGEGANDVDMNRADFDAASLAQVVDRGFDIFCSGAEGDEDGVGVVGFVLADEAVVAAGELAEVLVGGLEEFENGLGEIISARDDALHVVFLILHGAKEDGIGEVHHLGNAAAGGSEEDALGIGGAIDDVFGRAKVFADQVRFMLVEGALKVAGQEAIHDVHAGGERKLGNAAKNEGLVGGLLRVFAEEHDPAGVERAINIVVTAMDVEGVLGEGARAHFNDHGAGFAGGVVILLDAIDYALAGGEVDDAFAADRVGNCAALGRVFAFSFDGDGVVAEDVQMALGVGLLEELAALGGRGDGVKHAGVGDARLGVVGDKLISVCGDTNTWITRSYRHESLS